ncbi:hypothetical protein A1O1_09133 [Capronia coronata CBS 617.96]|uniref:Uncharacterized protein n=1 Tax=Capronia coronata CBS 617.96 TaxID=1182541 RepID=W9XP34_9EURO|nr:uncharacterized protein A1O1_09133 [Capronia coronata CBS 617.96]EXJ78731.1 hypothetical protein A1O1_09133 [Capronia coronata CBS 617.96]
MAPERAYVSLFPNSIIDVDLWKRFYNDEEITADVPPPVKASADMATSTATGSKSSVSLSVSDQEQAITYLLDQSIESILHDMLLDIHQEEKIARMQTAVVEVEQKAEKLRSAHDDNNADDKPVESNAAVLKSGQVQLKGNPMKNVKHIRCPNCRLRRLLYPRVGFNSRPVPDPAEQYCKNEPMIIMDKHDVHGQRKKGVKVKGQAKGKNKRKNDPASPASENSDPLTPSSSIPNDSFEFKEIDYPAAKCPNRESHLGDHWKSVNVFATHLNGSCYLKKDRAAGREANAKIGGTPRDSRASSPKAGTNGNKRKADDDTPGGNKKKQKLGDVKKNEKKGGSGPSRLKEVNNVDDQGEDSPLKEVNGDTISVTPTKAARDASMEPTLKLKLKTGATDGIARKKPGKTGKKA